MSTGYKTIAVHVGDELQSRARVKLAARLATRFESHLIGVAATGLPSSLYFGGLTGEGAAIIPSYIDMLAAQAGKALIGFDKIAASEGIQTPEKRVIEEEAGVALCLLARYADLLVVAQGNPYDAMPGEPPMVAEYALLHAVSPMLVVPHAGEFEDAGRRVLVAWDGSLPAARAVHGAIPLLRQAGLVQIAVFDAGGNAGEHGEEPGADIALFLARHGVEVEVARYAIAGPDNAGDAILSRSVQFGADLVVMGGYGHTRFREVLLGGATRAVLRGMNVPVLISH